MVQMVLEHSRLQRLGEIWIFLADFMDDRRRKKTGAGFQFLAQNQPPTPTENEEGEEKTIRDRKEQADI